ncbi:hypothetical protein NEOLEDRAFT_1178995 [Neolentinus lepideus HHB14362 ss-1]|uniref:REJ domain-containing protein n=1 Tax=Neolentinus lepideus HHB14362 ss-1 TaxID=1314782 RepID=A0A165S3I0_9AGAM|nr:hypothetical protein NEOLEDRAFT_1178995 [Neolentinus lepideus HHB14362 ss-1]
MYGGSPSRPLKRVQLVAPRQTSAPDGPSATATTATAATPISSPAVSGQQGTSSIISGTSDSGASASASAPSSGSTTDSQSPRTSSSVSDSDGPSSSVSQSSSQPASSSSSSPSAFSTISSTSSSTTVSPSSTFSSTSTSSSPSSTTSSSSSRSSSSSSSSTSSTPSSSSSSTDSSTTSSTETTTSFQLSTTTSSGHVSYITSSTVITENGQVSTSYTVIPTIWSGQSTPMSTSQRNAIIAGSVVAGCFLLTLLGALLFFHKRHQYKKLFFFRRKPAKPRSQLLAGEDFEDDHDTSMQQYRDDPFAARRSYDSGPSLMRPRQETGSLFHEAVWPPPSGGGRFIDPLVAGSSNVDLSGIVDNVMGPSSGQHMGGGVHASEVSLDSYYPPSSGGHARDGSTSSQTGLLETSHGFTTPPYRSSPLAASSVSVDTGGLNPKKNWLDRSPKKVNFSEVPSNPPGLGVAL